jgi:hypothetical protein
MDYKTFLDFVLAMENKNTLPGLQYLWKLLSLGQDHMDSFTINYFFRDIVGVLKENGIENIKTEDVQDEIFDMISPVCGDRITFDELWKSGCGETVVEMLIDINGFWGYENRENYAEENEEYDEEVEGLMTA